MKRRKIDNRVIHRLALECIADQIEAILDNSEHEISIVEGMGGTDNDYTALRRAMIRVCEQLRRRAAQPVGDSQ